MIFRIEITDMAPGSNELFKMGLLIDEIGLYKEKSAAAAVVDARVTLESVALSPQSALGVKTSFREDFLHALEPSGHCGVIIGEI